MEATGGAAAGATTLPASHTRPLAFAPGRKAEAMKFLDSLPAHIRNDPVAVRTYLKELHRMRAPQDSPLLLVCPLGACEGRNRTRCPAHCSNVSCPVRGKGAMRAPWLRKNMEVVRSLLPSHPPPIREASQRRLLLVTTTYSHIEQLMRLEHLIHVVANEPNVLWVVVEDAAETSHEVAQLLREHARVKTVHLAHGPTRRGGNAQRNVALQYIRDNALEGVVYNLDDDNGYHPRLWNELRRVGPRRVGVLAVRRGVFPPPKCDGRFLNLRTDERRVLKLERPLYDNATGQFVRFEAGWCDKKGWMARKHGARKFCVDMGGFAFDAALLHHIRGKNIWGFRRHTGGETELIEKLLPEGSPEDLQPLGNCCQDVFVFHNEWKINPIAMLAPPSRCGADGRAAPVG